MIYLQKIKKHFYLLKLMTVYSLYSKRVISNYKKIIYFFAFLFRYGKLINKETLKKTNSCDVSTVMPVSKTNYANFKVIKETFNVFENRADITTSVEYSNVEVKKLSITINDGLIPQPLGFIVLINIIHNQINLYK